MKKSFKVSRSAFTLVELSVVIVILSILIATVLVSRTLILGAKINKIQEDYRGLLSATSMFYDAYSCMPGDCRSDQINDLTAKGLPSMCTSNVTTASSAYMVPSTGIIDSPVKRTCMLYSLQIAGYINTVDPTYATAGINSLSGLSIPYAKFDKKASWDYRFVTGNATVNSAGSVIMPLEAGTGSLAGWNGQPMMVLRSSNVNTITGATTYDIATTTVPADTGVRYGITSAMASKLDLKFDDGLPYSGSIMGGRSAADFGSTAGVVCNTNNVAGVAGVATGVTYLNTNDITKGCLVAYLVSINN